MESAIAEQTPDIRGILRKWAFDLAVSRLSHQEREDERSWAVSVSEHKTADETPMRDARLRRRASPAPAGFARIDEPNEPPSSVLIHRHKLGVRLQETTYDQIAFLEKWKKSVLPYIGYLERHAKGVFDKVEPCGSFLEFRKYVTCEGQPEKLAAANFCKMQHHCVSCAAMRAARVGARLSNLILYRILSNEKLFPAMLTITMKNNVDLSKMVNVLSETWFKWWRQGSDSRKGKRRPCALTDCEGAVFSAETKLGRGSNMWHFHAHIIVLVPDGKTKHDYYPEWSELLGYQASCDFRYLRCCEMLRNGIDDLGEFVADMLDDLKEPIKYALKTNELPHAEHLKAAQILSRKRLIRTYGSLYSPEAEASDFLDDETDFSPYPFQSFRFDWAKEQSIYGQRTTKPKTQYPPPPRGEADHAQSDTSVFGKAYAAGYRERSHGVSERLRRAEVRILDSTRLE